LPASSWLAAELAVERATDRDLQCLHALQTGVEGFHPDDKLDDYFANARQTLRRIVVLFVIHHSVVPWPPRFRW
jgi:hypothetical protein